ncbi:hypothetical protein ROA7450_00088 [Roseovarius albus]|uniref:Uncharacterized protein n=1 Tax=Roseovarius albus TaxID=1247867 RepID=A0A1X6Y5N6_9RHOB|nr:hypothetical protein [Roseovarius albus]SLN11423.1 hypothetical protein ROA7450_00088 [Roseovarius albus]
MASASTAARSIGAIPALNASTLGLMFISGFFATNAFDLWGQVISPSLGYASLSPHGLAKSLLGSLGLPNSDFAGYFVHFYLVGLIGYPTGWLYIFAPIWRRVVGNRGWFIPSALYGFGLWIFAIGGITSLAGLPFFLNWSGIVGVALVGHVLYSVVMVATMRLVAR